MSEWIIRDTLFEGTHSKYNNKQAIGRIVVHQKVYCGVLGNGINHMKKQSLTTRWNRPEPPGDLFFLLSCIGCLTITAHYTSPTSGGTHPRTVLFCPVQYDVVLAPFEAL